MSKNNFGCFHKSASTGKQSPRKVLSRFSLSGFLLCIVLALSLLISSCKKELPITKKKSANDTILLDQQFNITGGPWFKTIITIPADTSKKDTIH